VPGEAYQQLVGLKGEVEQCHQDLKAAEAAVEAVAKVGVWWLCGGGGKGSGWGLWLWRGRGVWARVEL
jgi:hypothetical protein